MKNSAELEEEFRRIREFEREKWDEYFLEALRGKGQEHENTLWWRLSDEDTFDIIRPLFRGSSRVRALEVGCGSGGSSFLLRAKIPITVLALCDVSPQALRFARTLESKQFRTPTGFVQADMFSLPFANASQQSLVIIVLDLLSTKPIQREDGKQLMIKFLSSRLPRGQMVAELSITSKGLQSIHPFSTDTKSLIEALRKTPTGAETIMPRPNVVDTTIGAITELAQSYAGVEGRKTMIFAAGNIAELVGENQIVESSAISDSLRRMWRSLIGANISVYPIGLMDWAARPDQLTARQQFSVNTFADATGGGRCVESNDLMGCLAEAVQDSRSYYMLGFSVPPEDRKPGWRNLKVKVSVEHASVSARNGFYYGTPPVEQAKRPSELKALASALPQSAIPMFVKVLGPQPGATPNSASSHAADGNAAGKNSIAFRITIPLNGLLVDPSSRSALDLEVGAIALTQDKKGPKEAAEFLQPVKGDPNPENLQTWAKEGIRLPVTLDLPPGSYDLRFFARDNNSGHIGTVVFPLEVK